MASSLPGLQVGVADSFPKFMLLPVELRNLIWDFTFPEPRIIKGGMFMDSREMDEDWEDREVWTDEFGYIALHPNEVLSQLHKIHFDRVIYFILKDFPAELRDPISLQVHRESRAYTLGAGGYSLIAHPSPDVWYNGFYFNPKRDVLWVSEGSDIELLQRYDEQLSKFTTALFSTQTPWTDTETMIARLEWFPSLKEILLVVEDPKDSEEKDPKTPAKYYLNNANTFRQENAEIILRNGWQVRCIDKSCNRYD